LHGDVKKIVQAYWARVIEQSLDSIGKRYRSPAPA
jgi:hypothetical protein